MFFFFPWIHADGIMTTDEMSEGMKVERAQWLEQLAAVTAERDQAYEDWKMLRLDKHAEWARAKEAESEVSRLSGIVAAVEAERDRAEERWAEWFHRGTKAEAVLAAVLALCDDLGPVARKADVFATLHKVRAAARGEGDRG